MVRAVLRLGLGACGVGLVVALAAVPAHACPVCFGNDTSPLTDGARAAAFVLVGVTLVMLAGLGALALALYRRQRATAAPEAGA